MKDSFDKASGKPVKINRKDRIDGKRRDPVYFQTLGFTCGPSALITAMSELDPDYEPSRLEELNIWREANLVFMGAPPAGCGPYGLAVSALRRGFGAEVFRYQVKDLFMHRTASKEEAEAQRQVSAHDRQEAEQAGALLHKKKLSPELIREQLAQQKKLIVLTNHVPDGHWVLIREHKDNGDLVIVADPYRAKGRELKNRFFTNTGRNVLSWDEFEQWTSHGKAHGTLMLAITKP